MKINKKIIILAISLVIIVVGIVMALTLKFNLSLDYGKYTCLNVYMNQESNLDDVRQIVEENYNGQYSVEYTDEFNDTITIKLKDATDDEITQIKDKLTEKYEFEDETDNIIQINVPSIKIYDLIKDYIMPVLLSFVIIIVYFGIIYRKLGIYTAVIEPIITVIIAGALYVSILAICRIPINEYIVPIGIFIYIISVLGNTICLSNKKNKI